MADKQKLVGSAIKVAAIFEAYLKWVSENRSPATYDKAVHYLSLFIRFVGSGFHVSSLKGSKVTEWLGEYPHWTPSAGNDAAGTIQRAFNWAVEMDYLESSPVSHIPNKPIRKRREIVFNEDEWRELRALVTDQKFGDLLDFMWEVGCRPIECRTMEARHIDLKNELVVFPPSEAKGRHHERVIFLTAKAKEICARRMQLWPTGPIMQPRRGRRHNASDSGFGRSEVSTSRLDCR